MSTKEMILSSLEIFDGLGKEIFAIATLAIGVIFRSKGFIDGGQLVELIKGVGMAYMASNAAGGIADVVRAHLESK